MTKPLTAHDPSPPRWAEYVLRLVLKPRDRDTISGDLLEEYREVALPTLGPLRANVWYVKQTGSLMNSSRLSLPSSVWLTLAVVVLAAVLFLLVRSDFRPPVPLAVFASVAAVLGMSGLTVMRSTADVGTLWRASRVFGVLCSAVFMLRMLVDTVAPRDVVEAFLAQSRGTYSEFNDPRRWLLGAALAMIFVVSGFWGAWRTGDVRHGTVAAMATSVIGSVLTLAIVALGMALSLMIGAGVAAAFAFQGGGIPMAPPILVMISAVLGTIGAMFGRGLGGTRREKASTT
jgi:hypothetical protein